MVISHLHNKQRFNIITVLPDNTFFSGISTKNDRIMVCKKQSHALNKFLNGYITFTQQTSDLISLLHVFIIQRIVTMSK